MVGPFPNKLLLEIFANLTKADGKTARLVSTIWSTLAAKFVFDTVHIGPQDEGLKVFTAIAEHPILNTEVIQLELRRSAFRAGHRQERLLSDVDKDDCRIVRWATKLLPLRAEELNEEERFCLLSVVEKGYESYLKQARQQIAWLHNAPFWEAFTRGLQRLRGIRHVEFKNSWVTYRAMADTYPLHLQPGFRTDESQPSQLSCLFRALQHLQIDVRSLSQCIDTSAQILSPQNQLEDDLSPLLEGIRDFSLGSSSYCETGSASAFLELISSMRSLKCLKLYLTRFDDFDDFDDTSR
ncbi:MAG: hypothetical protein Q9217_000178 [Psora testacea]